ncbi:hypothetical protein [Malonomonas rubra]|uniref:hypothetical protein n=1 Tax=Malonomonas rubra TaxID=57040 RepID=UPI0026EBAEFF|nr:hypothetical protein [Malonomonas rubra]
MARGCSASQRVAVAERGSVERDEGELRVRTLLDVVGYLLLSAMPETAGEDGFSY